MPDRHDEKRRAGRAIGPALLVWALLAAPVMTMAASTSLVERIAAAADGDIIHLTPGRYQGPVTIDKSITLQGEPGALIEGDGSGSVIVVSAAEAQVRGLTITGSGLSLRTMDSGVVLKQSAHGAVVADNRIEDNLIGVHIEGAPDSMVENNTIIGRKDLRVNERGNGVYLWNAPGAQVIGNTIRYGRDGIFTTTSTNNLFSGNHFSDLRYAVHYMYTEDSTLRDNVSVDNHIGYAIMFSARIKVLRNVSRGDRDHGLLFNFVNYSEIADNAVANGGEKCVFIYNANFNEFQGNHFEGCDIGIHFTAGSEQNLLIGNAFIGNRTQVKYVGTRDLRWADEERGNYWSDHAAFDLDGDGIADQAYRPNGLVDQIMWRVPQAKLLLSSPAVQLLRWAQGAFPAILPGGVIDTAPLMRPPELPASVVRELSK